MISQLSGLRPTYYGIKGILEAAFELGDCRIMSDDPQDHRQIKILNRILTLDETGLTFEADPRHIELLARSLNLTECRKVGIPGVKRPYDSHMEDEDSDTDDLEDSQTSSDAAALTNQIPTDSKLTTYEKTIDEHDNMVQLKKPTRTACL